MDNRLGGNNTQQRLIGGQTAPQSAPRRESGDVFVANVGEKRYLWTARAFAIITAISLCCNVVLLLAIAQVMPLFRMPFPSDPLLFPCRQGKRGCQGWGYQFRNQE